MNQFLSTYFSGNPSIYSVVGILSTSKPQKTAPPKSKEELLTELIDMHMITFMNAWQKVEFESIVHETCLAFGIDKECVFLNKNYYEIVKTRQCITQILFRYKQWHITDCARLFQQHHSTAIHSIRTINNTYNYDMRFTLPMNNVILKLVRGHMPEELSDDIIIRLFSESLKRKLVIYYKQKHDFINEICQIGNEVEFLDYSKVSRQRKKKDLPKITEHERYLLNQLVLLNGQGAKIGGNRRIYFGDTYSFERVWMPLVNRGFLSIVGDYVFVTDAGFERVKYKYAKKEMKQ